jgi:hypothetical protein
MMGRTSSVGRTIAEIKQALSDWSDSVQLPNTLNDLRIRINQALFNLTSTHHNVNVTHGPPGTVVIRCHASVIQTVQEIANKALPLGSVAEVVSHEEE